VHSARSTIFQRIEHIVYKYAKEDKFVTLNSRVIVSLLLLAIWTSKKPEGGKQGKNLVLSGESDIVCLFQQGDGCT